MVPEAMVHSVKYIGVPVVREVSGKATFSIPRSAKITTSPGPYENCCRIFKSKALKIYVSHRLAGMGEGATLAIMAKTIRETDMFDQ
jgi:hypothetical protein